MNLNLLAKKVHALAREKGWYKDGERNVGELIALIHSELSEALEELRKGNAPNHIYYTTVSKPVPGTNGGSMSVESPEGFPVEIADVIIRILDMCGYLNIDIEEALEIKMQYNEGRTYRHGKQF